MRLFSHNFLVLVLLVACLGTGCPSSPVSETSEGPPVRVRPTQDAFPLSTSPISVSVTNTGSDTLYYDPCASGVYLEELDTEAPRSFNVGNMDACLQRDPLAPGDSAGITFGTSFVEDRIAAGGLASRYRLRLPETFYRGDQAGERYPYVLLEGAVFSEPFRLLPPR